KNLVTCISYKSAVFPLGRQAMVAGDDSPAIGQSADFFAASVDHGLHGENHAGLQFFARTGFTIVQDLRVLMEFTSNAMTTVFAHHGKALLFSMLLDGMPNIAQRGAGT